nr:putative membrane transporter protein [Pandoravirus belohorizontensis]
MTDLLVAAALRAATAIAAAKGDDADFATDLSTAATAPDVPPIDAVRLGVIAVAATVAAAVSAVTAFGMAVTFHAIAHGVAAAGLAAIDAGAAVAYLMCMAIPAFWPLAVAHRRHIWWGLAGVLFVPSAVFTYVGTLLLMGQPPAVLRPLLGASMLAIALWETARSRPLSATMMASEAPNGLTASSDPATTSDPFCEVIVDSGVDDDDDDADSVDEREARRPLLSPPPTATGRPTSSLTVGVVVLAVVCGVASGLLGGVLCLHGPPLMIFAAVVPMPVERMYAPPPPNPLSIQSRSHPDLFFWSLFLARGLHAVFLVFPSPRPSAHALALLFFPVPTTMMHFSCALWSCCMAHKKRPCVAVAGARP